MIYGMTFAFTTRLTLEPQEPSETIDNRGTGH